ncbi:MAG: hypothetical protein IT360_24295 [Gemmatimonadaceae bacterium]|nr:hypothetical protein [Gemmatimonadaceae bacterium]
MPDTPAPFGCLVIATGLERDPARAQLVDDHLDAVIALAAMLGAAPIVVVHDGTPRVAAPARSFPMPRQQRDDLSAMRLGLMQFTNSAVGAALVLPIEAHATSAAMLTRMIHDAQDRQVPLAATALHGALGFPLYATRDTWRELMTAEGGLDAVVRHYGPRVLAVEPGD